MTGGRSAGTGVERALFDVAPQVVDMQAGVLKDAEAFKQHTASVAGEHFVKTPTI